MEEVTGPDSLSTLKLKHGWRRSLSLITSSESTENQFRELLVALQSRFGIAGLQPLLILNRLAKSQFERKCYAQAESISGKILNLATIQPLTTTILPFVGRGLSLMSRAQLVQGNLVSAEANLK